MTPEDETRAVVLRCVHIERPSNVVLALENRERYGNRRCRPLLRMYRADLTLSKLKFFCNSIGYDRKTMRWKIIEIPRKPLDFIGTNGAFLGLSSDSTYLITQRIAWTRSGYDGELDFLELTPETAVLRHFVHISDLNSFTRLRVYFHPFNRFISTFIYNQSDLISAYKKGISESSTFRVVTFFPDLLIRITLSSSATIVCRKVPQRDNVIRKDYLRIHSDGFVLNTGVTLLMILFSNSPPVKLKYMQKVWRVVMVNKEPVFGISPSVVSADLGEELSVGSSIPQEHGFEGLSYKLVECEGTNFNDRNQLFGLRKPLFVSRHVVCMESLIDRAVTVFIRRSKLFKGACYKGSRDYETDVNCVDEQGTCRLITICVCEFQVPTQGSDNTQNIFYVCRVDSSWNIYRGWIPGGTCRILKQLTYEIAFNPRLWYPYSRFPVEQDEYAYNLASRGVLSGDLEYQRERLSSVYGNMDVILDVE